MNNKFILHLENKKTVDLDFYYFINNYSKFKLKTDSSLISEKKNYLNNSMNLNNSVNLNKLNFTKIEIKNQKNNKNSKSFKLKIPINTEVYQKKALKSKNKFKYKLKSYRFVNNKDFHDFYSSKNTYLNLKSNDKVIIENQKENILKNKFIDVKKIFFNKLKFFIENIKKINFIIFLDNLKRFKKLKLLIENNQIIKNFDNLNKFKIINTNNNIKMKFKNSRFKINKISNKKYLKNKSPLSINFLNKKPKYKSIWINIIKNLLKIKDLNNYNSEIGYYKNYKIFNKKNNDDCNLSNFFNKINKDIT